jgi:hypothetical protein
LARFGDKAVRSRPTEHQEAARESGQRTSQIGSGTNSARFDQRAARGGNDSASRLASGTHNLAYVNFATLEVNQDLIYRP